MNYLSSLHALSQSLEDLCTMLRDRGIDCKVEDMRLKIRRDDTWIYVLNLLEAEEHTLHDAKL